MLKCKILSHRNLFFRNFSVVRLSVSLRTIMFDIPITEYIRRFYLTENELYLRSHYFMTQ